MVEDEDFPRGGARKRKQRGTKTTDESATALFDETIATDGDEEEVRLSKRTKRKIKLGILPEKIARKKNSNVVAAKLRVLNIEPLTAESLNVGMLILGCIREINRYELVVSLPYGLRGYVSVTNISDAYTERLRKYVDDHSIEDVVHENEKALALLDMFTVGSYVVCRVKSLYTLPKHNENSVKKIALSMNPRDVNEDLTQSILYDGLMLPAAVRSVEDHGFVMDIGFLQTTAFLKREHAKKYEQSVNKRLALQVGQVIFCAIDMPEANFLKDRHRVIELTAAPKRLLRTKVNNELVNRRALMPGSRVSATVSAIESHGLCLDCSTYKALVHRSHLDKFCHDIGSEYQIKQEVTGRILYVHPVSKVPYVSLLPELCALFPRNIFSELRLWELIESAKVSHMNKERVEFDLSKGVRGMAPKSNVPNRKDVTVGSTHSCRIMELHYMERCALLSLKTCDLERNYLFIENLKLGDKIKCAVISVQAEGIRVSAENLFGLIPNGHLDDGPVQDAGVRFRTGRKLRCRVLNLYPERNFLILTHKKSLVTSDKIILSSYQDASPGMIVEGSIVAILDSGLVLRFYGNVKGFVYKNNVVKKGRSVILTKAFRCGQTVPCKILGHDVATNRLKLSLNIDDEDNVEGAVPSQKQFSVGKLVSCRVSAISKDGLDVEIFPSGVQAFIPKMHLSDHPSNCALLLKTYKVGDVMDEVFCFATGLPPIATLKPTFIEWAKSGHAFDDFSQLKAGLRVPAVVQNYSEYGLFVNLPCNLRALVPSHILDSNDLRDVHEWQQTLIGVVKNLGKKQNEVAISVAPTDVAVDGDFTAAVRLENYLTEQARIRRFAAKSGQVVACALCSLTVGTIVDFVVGAASPHGVVGRTSGGVRSLVTNQQLSTENASLDVGTTLQALVLAVDFEEECAELSLRTQFVNSSARCTPDSLTVGVTIDAVCALIKDDYCLVALQAPKGTLYGYMPSKTHPNEAFNFGNLPVVGESFKVDVYSLTGTMPIVLRHSDFSSTSITKRSLYSIWESSQSKRFAKIQENQSPSPTPPPTKRMSRKYEPKIYSSLGSKSKRRNQKSRPDAELQLGVDLQNYSNLDELSCIINSYLDVPDDEKFVDLDTSDSERSSSDTDVTKPKRRKSNLQTRTKVATSVTNGSISSSSEEGLSTVENAESESQSLTKANSSTTRQAIDENTSISEKKYLRRLNVTSSFLWDVENNANTLKQGKTVGASSSGSSSGSDEEGDDTITQNKAGEARKAKRNRGLQAKLEEQELFRTENLLVDADRQPETADDFDRLVLCSPDSSLLWLKYMAFHLQSAEFDKARSVAERALKTISFREEQEKLNVWAALLNLENQYGMKEALNGVFQRALQYNEPIKVYKILANIYEQSDNLDAAEKLHDVMVKRFKNDIEVWVDYFTFLMKHDRVETARKALEKSLIVLPKLKHVMMITKFVCLEFKYGGRSGEQRGRTMMESVLAGYPRRMDVWSVYVDLVTKSGDIDGARLIYERLLKLKGLQARKMRSVFKKYLDFEKKHGTDRTVSYVTNKAREYVDNLDEKDFE